MTTIIRLQDSDITNHKTVMVINGDHKTTMGIQYLTGPKQL